ncbi:MAG: sensor histidine kinase [Leptothrix sp. (in: b-proteobacteria)]
MTAAGPGAVASPVWTAPTPPRWSQRLGVRLVLLFVLLALVMSLTFMAGMQRALGGGWRALVRPLVADYVDRLADEIGSPPDVARAQALVERLPLAIRIEGPVVNWTSHPDGWPRVMPPAPPLRSPLGWLGGPDRPPHHRRPHAMGGGPEGRDGRDARDGRDVRDSNEPPNPPLGERGFFTLQRQSADGHRILFALGEVPLQHQPRVIGWVTLALLLVVTALAYGVVRRLLRPLAEIRAGAVRFGQGAFDAPIPVRRGDELGQLAGQINTMAAELKHMLDAKRALLLAISHELRSPLTRARLHAELVDEGQARDALLRDLGEMRELITDLLESEQLAAGHRALQTEPTDLAALVRQTVAEVLARRGLSAPGEATPVDCQLEELGLINLDPTRWRLLVRNLVDNALRHGRPAAAQLPAGVPQPPALQVRLSRGDAGLAVFSVRDHGPGVDAAQLAHLSEPFYRTDAARDRHSGGVGLGLYLSRLVAQAHGGELRLRAADPGLIAEVRWPVA